MTFTQENAYLILLHGCSLVEDFNNFRLCGSAASHANTKLRAAKYMAWKVRLLKARPSYQLSLSDSEHEKINICDLCLVIHKSNFNKYKIVKNTGSMKQNN